MYMYIYSHAFTVLGVIKKCISVHKGNAKLQFARAELPLWILIYGSKWV
jgi:hypothetical protein